MKAPLYLTTPIYYVNDVPHIGHMYTTLACDMVARFMRLDGREVFFVTGTDEHGQKNAKSAAKVGKTPQQYVDELSLNFKALGEAGNFSYDMFIRTTENRHIKAAQALWEALKAKGQIYLGRYAGWYSVRDEAYYNESELVEGKAPTGAPVEWVEEQSYFFKLSEWQEPLLAFYKAHPDFVAPQSRYNEVVRFVEGGLRDLSISRTTFNWGVPVPEDDRHIMYVWLDALTNYLTCVDYPAVESSAYQKFWPHALHVVGKDILRFHAVYWPAFLMAAGLTPPQKIFAHGWWTNEGQKISKSLGNTIDPFKTLNTYGVDQVRYFLLREVPFGADGDFSTKALVQRINSDLANAYGNLVQRVLSFIYKNNEGKIPELKNLTLEDEALLTQARDRLTKVREQVETLALHRACEQIWELIAEANRYIDVNKPWALKGVEEERMQTVLAVLVDAIRRIALLTQPIMPQASSLILDQLGVEASQRMFSAYDNPLLPYKQINQPYGVFPRWEEKNAG